MEGRLGGTRQSWVGQWCCHKCTRATAAGWTGPNTLRVWQPLMDGRMKIKSCGCGCDWSAVQQPHLKGKLHPVFRRAHGAV